MTICWISIRYNRSPKKLILSCGYFGFAFFFIYFFTFLTLIVSKANASNKE